MLNEKPEAQNGIATPGPLADQWLAWGSRDRTKGAPAVLSLHQVSGFWARSSWAWALDFCPALFVFRRSSPVSDYHPISNPFSPSLAIVAFLIAHLQKDVERLRVLWRAPAADTARPSCVPTPAQPAGCKAAFLTSPLVSAASSGIAGTRGRR